MYPCTTPKLSFYLTVKYLVWTVKAGKKTQERKKAGEGEEVTWSRISGLTKLLISLQASNKSKIYLWSFMQEDITVI